MAQSRVYSIYEKPQLVNTFPLISISNSKSTEAKEPSTIVLCKGLLSQILMSFKDHAKPNAACQNHKL
jgi:hypothetical protein